MKKFLAIFFAKLAMFFSRLLRRGGGSALPGLIAETLDKNILAKLVSNLKFGAVIITGTNGKTTSAKMTTDILRLSGMDVISNESGSNLSRGIVSTLIARSSIFGKRTKGDIAIFEIDEATMLQAVPKISPKIVAVTNIFRDQLDRYGEVDKTALLIGNSLRNMPKGSTVILNADDPLVSSLQNFHSNAAFFGLEDSSIQTNSKAGIDNKDCPKCGHVLDFEYRYFGHLGKYKCKGCGLERPKPENTVFNIQMEPEKTNITLHTSLKQNIDVSLNLPGAFNIYNALTAASTASMLGISGDKIKEGLEQFTAAFGRMERIQIKDKSLLLLLVKNPIGLTETLRSFSFDKTKNNFLFCLNDNFADGTDISWIWDAELELICDKTKNLVISGVRAEDMALRLKYAEVNSETTVIEKDIKKALDIALKSLDPGETLYVLPSYTAMMEIRNLLVKNGFANPFWKPPGV